MVGSRLELDIVRLYSDVKASYSILQISKLLNTSYPHVHRKVQELERLDILRLVYVGPSHLCQLNLESDLAKNLLCLCRIQERDEFLEKSLVHRKIFGNIKNLKKTAGFDFSFFLGKTAYIVSSADLPSLKRLSMAQKVQCKCITVAEFQAFLGTITPNSLVVLLGFERFYELLANTWHKQERGLVLR